MDAPFSDEVFIAFYVVIYFALYVDKNIAFCDDGFFAFCAIWEMRTKSAAINPVKFQLKSKPLSRSREAPRSSRIWRNLAESR